MPQARSGGSRRSSSSAGSRSTRSSSSRSGSSSSGGSARKSSGASGTSRASSSRASSSRSGASRSGASRTGTSRSSAGRGRSTTTRAKAASGSPEARLEAVAQRLRKLNDRIIDAGKEAGETTLTNYEKALKMIASGIERGPGSSEIDWISNLASAQAKFIRDVTSSWTSAARKALK